MNSPAPTGTRQTISFCVTCRNRLWQLEQTLGPNLSELGPNANITLVDYRSPDGLSKWVWSNFETEIHAGKLIFFEVTNDVAWHMARAKNLAHRIATGSYVFNLDGDNFISAHDVRQVEQAAALGAACSQWTGVWKDGSFGRIGLPTEMFMKLGGYDEGLLPMSEQDLDFFRRIQAVGLQVKQLRPAARAAVQNTIHDKVVELGRTEPEAEDWFKAMRKVNRQLSLARLKLEGPTRPGCFSSFRGKLNGKPVTIDGFGEIRS